MALEGMGFLYRLSSHSPTLPAGATEADAEKAAQDAKLAAAKAFESFKRAADKGDVKAMSWLGVLYEHGWDVPADKRAAADWYRRAADQGDAQAAEKLVQLLGYDGPEAMAINLKLAERGDSDAMNRIAGSYDVLSKQKDPAKEAEWRAKARAAEVEELRETIKREGLDVEPGRFEYDSAASELAERYMKGEGVKADPVEATRWYTLAADHGDARAAMHLFFLYVGDPEKGVRGDPKEAQRWRERWGELRVRNLRASAEDGDEIAMKELAQFLLLGGEGRGEDNDYGPVVAKDPMEAAKWLRKAVDAPDGDPEAAALLAELHRQGLGVAKDAEEAKRLDAKAAGTDPVRFGDLDELLATLDKEPGYAAIMASQRLAGEGRDDEAVFWYYVGQLRGRMEAETDSTAAQAYGAIFASVGPAINEYAAGDVDKLVATLDKVLAWDEAHPPEGIDPKVRAKQRKGLKDLRDYTLAHKKDVQKSRAKRGLPNRNE